LSPQRSRKDDNIREEIIKAAMKVFSRHGFFRTPVQLIAEEAGVSKGLVFWYFRTKQELIAEVAKRSLPVDVIDECIKSGETGKRLLECIGRNYLRKYRDPVQRNLLLHAMALETILPEVGNTIRELCEEKIVEIAEKAFNETSAKTKVAIRLFLGGLMCYTLRRPEDIDEETFLRTALEILTSNERGDKMDF